MTLAIATQGLIPGSSLCIATQGFICGEVVSEVLGGGSPYNPRGKYFDIRDLTYLYEPQEKEIEVIEQAGEPVNVEFEPPDKLIQNIPIDIKAPALYDIEDELEKELARLLRIQSIQEHAKREIEQALKELKYQKNKEIMLMLLLDEL